jgi:hypothetical protein
MVKPSITERRTVGIRLRPDARLQSPDIGVAVSLRHELELLSAGTRREPPGRAGTPVWCLADDWPEWR